MNMVNLITKYNKLSIIEDPDLYFNVHVKKMARLINTNETLMSALSEIDGVTEVYNENIVTKFGSTSIQNISTGTKSIVLMTEQPDKMVYDFELGINAIRFLNKQKEKYNLACTGCSWALDDSDRILIDNELVCGADNIDERIDSIYGQ